MKHSTARYQNIKLSITITVFLAFFSSIATANIIDGSINTDNINIENSQTTQNLQFAVEFDNSGTKEFSIDTSDLPEDVEVEDVSVSGNWDTLLISSDEETTVFEVDSGTASGDSGIEINFELDTTDYNAGNQQAEYTITDEETGSDSSVSFNINSENTGETEQSNDRTQVNENSEDGVFIVVESPEGEQLSGEDVEAWAQEGISYSHGTIQEDGRFKISPDPGTYNLRADANGYAPGTLYDVEITADENQEYTVKLEEGGVLEGEVTDIDSKPVADARVEIENRQGVQNLAHTDANGEYQKTLAPGAYTVRAWDNNRISEELHVITIESTEDTETLNFELQTPTITSSNLKHINGTEPDMNSFDLQTETRGGMVFVELGAEDTGNTAEEAFTPQDVSQYGVDESTVFEISLTVEDFNPDSLIWAGKNTERETSSNGENTEITVQTSPVHMETINDVHTGPTTEGDDINWPTDDTADNSYEQAIQFALIETPGLNPSERQALRGMSATTNAQAFGFPRIEDGEMSVYLGAPGETVNGEQHTGFYTVFLPDSLLNDWSVEDPEEDLEAMWKGSEEAFNVEEKEDGVQVEIEPITYSDGMMTIQSTKYEESFLDSIPSTHQLGAVASNLVQEAKIWIQLRLA